MKKFDYKINDETNVGTIVEIFPEQKQIETENGIFSTIRGINKINIEDLTIEEYSQRIKDKLINEYGSKKINLYHGLDSENYKKIKFQEIFGHSDNSISFFTNKRKEAKEYAFNKSKYRNVEGEGEVLKFSVPKWAVYKNKATGEYETPYQFHIKEYTNVNDGAKEFVLEPTKESLINFEIKDNMKLIKSFQFKQIQSLFYEKKGINLAKEIDDRIDWGNITDESVKEVKKYLKTLKSNIYDVQKVIMYHGTSAKHNITEEGLLKTTNSTKKSIQSQPGYVYLSMYSDSAKLFGEMGNPGEEVKIYAVEIDMYNNNKNKNLVPDNDQLKNKRMNNHELDNIKNNLENSLIYGNGGRVKSNIENYKLRDVTNIVNTKILKYQISEDKNYDIYLKNNKGTKKIPNNVKINN